METVDNSKLEEVTLQKNVNLRDLSTDSRLSTLLEMVIRYIPSTHTPFLSYFLFFVSLHWYLEREERVCSSLGFYYDYDHLFLTLGIIDPTEEPLDPKEFSEFCERIIFMYFEEYCTFEEFESLVTSPQFKNVFTHLVSELTFVQSNYFL